SAATSLGRLVLECALRPRHAAIVEHLTRHRRREAKGHHPLHKGATGKLAVLHRRNQMSERLLFHVQYPIQSVYFTRNCEPSPPPTARRLTSSKVFSPAAGCHRTHPPTLARQRRAPIPHTSP